MKTLKIAFLWHQHQPEYKYKDGFLLPWTRLHGVKDYFDIPEILHEFPEIKQTFNIVPSLLKQIYEFVEDGIEDKVQKLSKLKANELSQDNKTEILESFFLCNVENMILPYQRYRELYESREFALRDYTTQDWLDLQVWYNLTWIGYFSRNNGRIKRLFAQGRDFTERDKQIVMDSHLEILTKITKQYKDLADFGQVELSCSPFYHPILPLLIDSDSAAESIPNFTSPNPKFEFPIDADYQIRTGKEYFKAKFGFKPNGFWPSEGSISNAALDLLIQNKLKWTASDEQVIKNSLKDSIKPTDKFFPRRYTSKNGEIVLFFRDHFLSDRIGFIYSSWNPWDAANDFVHHLLNIRNAIIAEKGDEGLDNAVVSVILDGENCWEFYQDNGVPFLRELFTMLSNAKELETITFSEAIEKGTQKFLPPISKIQAGSWINADFSIWIGDEDDKKAWEMLTKARITYEKSKGKLSKEVLDKAYTELLIAEGSDWFWWYGPEHNAENKDDFDELFRWHIRNFYELIGESVPKEVGVSITKQHTLKLLTEPKGKISPNFQTNNDADWHNAGVYNPKAESSSMHQIGDILSKVFYGRDEQFVYLKFVFAGGFDNDSQLKLYLGEESQLTAEFRYNQAIVQSEFLQNTFEFKIENTMQIKLSNSILLKKTDKDILIMTITTIKDGVEVVYPRKDRLKLIF